MMLLCGVFFFFKQKTAYEMRISDWSSDVCSSDLTEAGFSVEDGRALQCLLRLVARARLAVAEVHRGRLVGRYVRPGDPFFASLMASPKVAPAAPEGQSEALDRKSTRLNSSH